MACATLKRSRDWEVMTGQGPVQALQPLQPLQAHLHQGGPSSTKRRRCTPSPFMTQPHATATSPSSSDSRVFGIAPDNTTARLTPERMAQEIYDEIKRLQHRRLLRLANSAGNSSRCDNDGSSSGSEGDSPQHPHSRALFTFKQVRVICERMLREQEAALRAEFEAALSGHLAEQYEAFVRFNVDQIQRRHHSSQDISYLS